MKSVSQAELPYLEGIFKLWMPEQQELPFLQVFISFANQNLEHTFKLRMVLTDQLFSDKIFAKFTLGIKIVLKFILEGMHGSIIYTSSFFFTQIISLRPYLIFEFPFVREKLVR